MDEVGFGRSIKEHYSWLPKGKSSVITNDIFTGRVNMILGVTINGDYLGLMTWRTVNSEDYCLYLTLLSKSLKGTENGIHNDVTVIQDNASIHRTNIVKTTASREKFTMYLLPQYSPDLAPVELMFGAVKRKIKGEIWRQGCRFSSECGKDAIIQAWASIGQESITRMWMTMIRQAKKYILNGQRRLKLEEE